MLIVNTPKVPNKAITEIHVISVVAPFALEILGAISLLD
jgi:hypothetical protein